jgi:hypothetical protein
LRTFARASQSAVNQKLVESEFQDRSGKVSSELETTRRVLKAAAPQCQHSLRCKVVNHH